MKNRKFCLLLFVIILLLLKPFVECRAFSAENIQFLIDREYFQEVKKLLKGAKTSVKMMMFEASYYQEHSETPTNQLIRELIAAQKRGVKVEVILEVRKENERTTKRNLETARMLKKAGVAVTLDSAEVTTHTKLLIIDDEKVVLGSTNWTYNALEKNHEINAVIYSKQAAMSLHDYFRRVQSSGRRF